MAYGFRGSEVRYSLLRLLRIRPARLPVLATVRIHCHVKESRNNSLTSLGSRTRTLDYESRRRRFDELCARGAAKDTGTGRVYTQNMDHGDHSADNSRILG